MHLKIESFFVAVGREKTKPSKDPLSPLPSGGDDAANRRAVCSAKHKQSHAFHHQRRVFKCLHTHSFHSLCVLLGRLFLSPGPFPLFHSWQLVESDEGFLSPLPLQQPSDGHRCCRSISPKEILLHSPQPQRGFFPPFLRLSLYVRGGNSRQTARIGRRGREGRRRHRRRRLRRATGPWPITCEEHSYPASG